MQKPMERLLTMVQYGIENGERKKCTANDLTGLGCANARCLKDNDGAESGYSLPLQLVVLGVAERKTQKCSLYKTRLNGNHKS